VNLSETQDDFVPYVPDASTFTEGGNAARMSGRPATITGIYAITTVKTNKEGVGRTKDDGSPNEQTFLRVEYTPANAKDEEDAKPVAEEYLLGGSGVVRASADGDQILLKPGKSLWRKLDGARFFDSAEKSGLGVMKTASLKGHFIGQNFELGGIAEEYTDKKGEKKSFTRLFPAKYIGAGAGTVAATKGVENVESLVDGIVLATVSAAHPNVTPVFAIQQAIMAQAPEASRQAAIKLAFSSEYQSKAGRPFVFAGGNAKLAA
jgi:hypothetical protein